MIAFVRYSCCLAFALCVTFGSAAAADWPQFLGPNRNGISAETGLLDHWPAGGPKEVWRVPGGVGMSGMAISGGIACTLVQQDGQQWVIALDAKTGQARWKTPLASEYKNAQGDGPRATPTIVGRTMFAFTGQGVLVALNVEDGKLLWSHDAVREHGGKVTDYGMACSPLVVGDLVVVTIGAPQACVVAYRLASGERAWVAGDDPAGYSSPVLAELDGGKQIVVFTGGSVIGVTPDSGTLLWRYPYETDYDCNTASPAIVGGKVLVSSGENHGTVLLSLKPADQKFEASVVWNSLGARSVLRSEWQTPLTIGGHLFGIDNVGSAGPVTHLTCLNAETGERVWQQPRFGKSNFIAADGKLLFSTWGGEFVVARASPKGYEEICRKQVCGATRQAPAIADGFVYLRDNREIVCLDVRRQVPAEASPK